MIEKLVYIIIGVLISCVVIYLKSYMNKKGENLATQEDINNLIEQIKATEETRAKIVNEAWVQQKRWDLKRDMYSKLLENLAECRRIYSVIIDREQKDTFHDTPEDKERKNEWMKVQWEKEAESVDIIRRTKAMAGIFLSNVAMDALDKLEKEWSKAEETIDWWEHLDSGYGAANDAYKAILDAAKSDLQM
jgi:hypothetical protein